MLNYSTDSMYMSVYKYSQFVVELRGGTYAYVLAVL